MVKKNHIKDVWLGKMLCMGKHKELDLESLLGRSVTGVLI